MSLRVRALGCLFGLDDCSGHTAGAYRRRLLSGMSLDYLKLGDDLVGRLTHSDAAREQLAALVATAQSRGIETIAVFVGDQATLRVLSDARVDFAQGFFIGSPAPVATPLSEIAAHAQSRQLSIAA